MEGGGERERQGGSLRAAGTRRGRQGGRAVAVWFQRWAADEGWPQDMLSVATSCRRLAAGGVLASLFPPRLPSADTAVLENPFPHLRPSLVLTHPFPLCRADVQQPSAALSLALLPSLPVYFLSMHIAHSVVLSIYKYSLASHPFQDKRLNLSPLPELIAAHR
jgi:hypothetical protein